MIRPAVVADVPAVLQLIRELAVYEREPLSNVKATEDDLRTALFGDTPAVWAHVADDGGRVVAAAVWYVTFSTWTGRHGMHLEDLIVAETARGSGVGAALFGELQRICTERGYARLDWRVLDWNVDAQRFYRRRGGYGLPQWNSWRIDLERS